MKQPGCLLGWRLAIPGSLAIALALASARAAAQVAVVVEFENAQLIPVSPWTLVLSAGAVALCAFVALRSRRGPTASALRILIAGGVVATAAGFGANTVRDAHAVDVPPTTVQVVSLGSSSPGRIAVSPSGIFNMVMSGAGHPIRVDNRSGVKVAITRFWFEQNSPDNPLLFYEPDVGQRLCRAGSALAVDDSCWLYLRASAHW